MRVSKIMPRERWTDADSETLTTLYRANVPVGEIVAKLGRTQMAVRRRANELGVERTKRGGQPKSFRTSLVPQAHRRWTADEDAYLIKWYLHRPYKKIARALRRKTSSVTHRVVLLGLSYQKSRAMMNTTDVSRMLGIYQSNITRRINKKDNPIPHHRINSFIEFGYSELVEWLDKGNVMAFDRSKISPDLYRMWDRWREMTITSTEIFTECIPLGEWLRKRGANSPAPICTNFSHQKVYHTHEIYDWAYRIGYAIPSYAPNRWLVIKAAWDSEWVMKGDIRQAVSLHCYTTQIAPYIDRSNFLAVRRRELCERLKALGRHDLAKRFQSVPIPWQELMRDYERRAK